MNPRAELASSATPRLAAQRRRGVRDARGMYDPQQFGCLALTIDGSELDNYGDDRRGSDYVWSSAWMEKDCRCIRPEFRRLVGHDRLSACRQHGDQAPPEIDPYPLSPQEREEIEDRIWMPIANRFHIPNRFRNIRLDTSEPTSALQAVREYLEGDCECCLVLAGPTGVGKSHAIIAGFRHEAVWTCAEGLAVYFSMATLARGLLSDERDKVLESCLEADLLCIDDVAGGVYVKEGGLVETLFEEILCDREGNKLAVMLTTNLTLPAFAEAVGDRVADRIRGEWGTWCSLPGS